MTEDNSNNLVSKELAAYLDLEACVSKLSARAMEYSIAKGFFSIKDPKAQEEPFSYGVVNFPERAVEADITSYVSSNIDTVEFHNIINFPSSIGFTKHPKVCKGCKNYYGRKDGDHVLICAIHPYGVESDNCIDYHA